MPSLTERIAKVRTGLLGFVLATANIVALASPSIHEQSPASASCTPFCAIPIRQDAFDHVDLRVGQSRVKQAELEVQRLRRSFSPEISSSAGVSVERMSKNDRFPIFNDNPYERFNLGTSITYDPDLFEKRADKVNRSNLLKEKMKSDLESIRKRLYFQSLIAYIEATQANFEALLLERSLSHATQRLNIIKKQIDLGLEVENSRLDAEDGLIEVTQRLRVARSKAALEQLALSHLYGSTSYPLAGHAIERVWVLPEFRTTNLLENPPLFIRKPVLDLEISFVERLIHEKSASPDLYLAADVSLASLLLGALVGPSSLAWSIGPRLQYIKKPDHEIVTAFHEERIREAVLLMESAWRDLAYDLDRHRLRLEDIQSAIEQEEIIHNTAIKRSAASRLRFETGSSDMAAHLKDLISEDFQAIEVARRRTQLTLEIVRVHWLLS